MPFRRRRPLLRAAAVGGGAYIAGKRSARLEEAQQPDPYAQAPQQYAPPPAAPASSGISTEALEKIKELAQLHDQGVLTDDEFAAEKARLLR
jgi:hypothetical protein